VDEEDEIIARVNYLQIMRSKLGEKLMSMSELSERGYNTGICLIKTLIIG
jgi:hypothetical protein